MSRILLVDDSPHALRMGERILEEEGFEVVALSNTDSALIRLEDVDPDVVIADATMPGRSGYEICKYLRMNPRHRRVRVILTTTSLETLDAEQFQQARADGELKKPFEASALVAAVRALAEAAEQDRIAAAPVEVSGHHMQTAPSSPFVAVVDAAEVRAAVTVALDAAMETMIAELTGRVLEVLQARPTAAPAPPAVVAVEPSSALPAAADEPAEQIPADAIATSFHPFRKRAGSILGLDISDAAPGPERTKE